MDKQEANKRLNALEAEAAKLREIINEPEMPEVKAGDVWELCGTLYSIHSSLENWIAANLESGGIWSANQILPELNRDFNEEGARRLGTFDEVFVRRSEVAKLLEIRDGLGDTIGVCAEAGFEFEESGVVELLKAIKGLTRP